MVRKLIGSFQMDFQWELYWFINKAEALFWQPFRFVLEHNAWKHNPLTHTHTNTCSNSQSDLRLHTILRRSPKSAVQQSICVDEPSATQYIIRTRHGGRRADVRCGDPRRPVDSGLLVLWTSEPLTGATIPPNRCLISVDLSHRAWVLHPHNTDCSLQNGAIVQIAWSGWQQAKLVHPLCQLRSDILKPAKSVYTISEHTVLRWEMHHVLEWIYGSMNHWGYLHSNKQINR
jgi:hypothetical protein